MKTILLFTVLLIITTALFAQAPDWLWANSAGGTSGDYGNSIALDDAGNTYVAGYFSDTATFGSTTLAGNGNEDIFVAKMDASGNWLWTTKAGGTGNDRGYSIALDDAGNTYVTGFFQGTATFGSTLLTSSGGSDIFLAKIGANGNWLWTERAGGTVTDRGYSITLDDAGNTYVT